MGQKYAYHPQQFFPSLFCDRFSIFKGCVGGAGLSLSCIADFYVSVVAYYSNEGRSINCDLARFMQALWTIYLRIFWLLFLALTYINSFIL